MGICEGLLNYDEMGQSMYDQLRELECIVIGVKSHILVTN